MESSVDLDVDVNVKEKEVKQPKPKKKGNALTRALKLVPIALYISSALFGSYSIYKFENLQVESFIGEPLVKKLTREQITQINVDLLSVKLKLMSLNLEKEKNILISSINEDDVLVDGDLSPEYRERYNQFMKMTTAPWRDEEIQEAKNLIVQANVALNEIKDGEFKDSFVRAFKKNFNELEILTKDETSVKVLNSFREKMLDKEFQNLSKKQDAEQIWNLYFKEQYGSEVNPVVKLMLGLE